MSLLVSLRESAKLLMRELAARPIRHASIALCVAVSTAALILGTTVVTTLQQAQASLINERQDTHLFELVSPSMQLGMFRIKRPGLLGGSGIESATLQRLQKDPSLKGVYPKATWRMPLSAHGGARLVGQDMHTDLFAEGVDEALLAKHVSSPLLKWNEQDPIPVVINPGLMQLYNQAVAPSLGFPLLDKEVVVGLEFTLEVGRSYMLGTSASRSSKRYPARIVGLSPYAMAVGIALPLSVMERLQRDHGLSEKIDYASVWVEPKDADIVPAQQAAQRVGLKLDQQARTLADLISLVTRIVVGLCALLLGLAWVSVAQAFAAQTSERQAELSLLLALGATPLRLCGWVLAQASLSVGAGVALGTLGSLAVVSAVQQTQSSLLSDAPWLSQMVFSVPASAYWIALVCTLSATLLGLVPPLLAVFRRPLATTLQAVER